MVDFDQNTSKYDIHWVAQTEKKGLFERFYECCLHPSLGKTWINYPRTMFANGRIVRNHDESQVFQQI